MKLGFMPCVPGLCARGTYIHRFFIFCGSGGAALSIFAGENWHLWLFFGVAVLATFYPPKLTPASVLAAFLVASGLSLCTELVQEFWIPGRAFEWQDMGLNQIGILAGTATDALIRRLGVGGKRRFGGGWAVTGEVATTQWSQRRG